ncbi:MAG: PadR family transcriptional regulator [Mycobacterium sp.]|nr:PadR family transcriptional regulator [Mycobacterium sp.]
MNDFENSPRDGRRFDRGHHPHHPHHPRGPEGFGFRGGGRRRGRGDIRALVLGALLDGPTHGYEVIRRLEESSGGTWTPSPGSIYPTLQLLEDEGLVSVTNEGGKKIAALTEEGRVAAAESTARLRSRDDGADDPAGAGRMALREAIGSLHLAAKQVGMVGSPEQIERAAELVRAARQELYRLLADA